MNIEELKDLIKNAPETPNNKILEFLAVLSEKHENLKQEIIKKTYELDSITNSYNKLLDEYKKRIKK
jgi:chromosome condensin MukBEF ATPase and DNA-binding subunit MukB